MCGGRSLSPSTEFRGRFDQVRSALDLHPAESTAARTFQAAAGTARTIATECLPLGIGVVMHLYPLCAARWVPLPWFSQAGFRRDRLLRAIDSHSLILANAGSERAASTAAPVTLSRTRDGVRINGTYDYVSLANVADIVMFCAPLAGSACTLFCAADLDSPSVRIGGPKFEGRMRLSDTCPVSFDNHRVPRDRCLQLPDEATLQCNAQYQRSWFHLLLGEAYLARIEHLHREWNLPTSSEDRASLNELLLLKDYALRLLDEATSPRAVALLAHVTAAIKLRVSWHAQSTAAALQGRDDVSASELRYLRRQPTSDDRILLSLAS
jgi:alkylation response protein AidB-like acyl-CoA dehydrogenase